MISNFSEEASEILANAKLEMLELKHPYVGTEHLVLAILHSDNEIKIKLAKYGLTYQKFKNEILNTIGKGSKKSEFFLHTPLLKKVIESAIMDSKENNDSTVTTNHLFAALLDVGEGIAIRIMLSMNLDIDDMYDEFSAKIYERKNQNKKLLLYDLGINISEKAKLNEIDPVIGRDNEIHLIEEILCRRTKNNPLLIGEPGVGKTAIVEYLANLIEKDEVPRKLSNKKIISLDMASAVAGTKYRGEFEERIKKILKELEDNEDIILFIDEIHTLIGAGGAEGAIDASNILKPALARGKIRCIGATTKEEYNKHFSKDKALERRFQVVNIDEPTINETLDILYKLKPIYEKYHNVKITNDIIDSLVTLSEKYLYDRFRPDKQIDILDEVCSKVSIKDITNKSKNKENLLDIRNKKELYIKENNIRKAYEYKIKETKYSDMINKNKETISVTINDIAEVINAKTKIPIYEILKDNKRIILDIKSTLENTIIGQDNAISKLINITKRIKFGYKDNKCISLLFTGPSGVGKTKLAITYGNLISKKVIKLDMSEYSDTTSINKFMGSNPGYIGYDDNKYALSIIKDNPNAVIILDEIDKAHPSILNLLYQILEDGKITDSKNNIINFNNNIIIMTSNSCSNTRSIGFNAKNNNPSEDFNISLLGRIDNIILFNRLNEDNIKIILNKEIDKLKEKYHNTKIDISNTVIDEIINESNYQEYGARKINKILTDKIENIIIDNIIDNNYDINIDSILSK